MQRRAYLSMLETTQRCERAGAAVRLMYTNPHEQRRTDVNAARDKRAILQAIVNSKTANSYDILDLPSHGRGRWFDRASATRKKQVFAGKIRNVDEVLD
jgi:uncharacterized protein (DUF934 family)